MRRFCQALAVAFSGIGYAVRTQRHMRIHLIAAVLVCLLAVVLSLDPIKWSILLLTIALVICAELMNTAIEQTVNLVTTSKHPFAKAAKDVAAGVVLAAAILAVVIGLLILGPPLWQSIF